MQLNARTSSSPGIRQPQVIFDEFVSELLTMTDGILIGTDVIDIEEKLWCEAKIMLKHYDNARVKQAINKVISNNKKIRVIPSPSGFSGWSSSDIKYKDKQISSIVIDLNLEGLDISVQYILNDQLLTVLSIIESQP